MPVTLASLATIAVAAAVNHADKHWWDHAHSVWLVTWAVLVTHIRPLEILHAISWARPTK